MKLDYRNTKFIVTKSERADRLYALTIINGNHVIAENDDAPTGLILTILLSMKEYFEKHGATGEELIKLLISNIILRFKIEDMIERDPTLEYIVEKRGLKAYERS